jgi:hypothetical protein
MRVEEDKPFTLPPMTDDLNIARPEQFVPLTKESFHRSPDLPGMEIRNISFGELSAGKVAAQVYRACDGWSERGSVWHMHELEHRIGYVIRGWCKYEMEGLGEVVVEAGSAIYHISRNRFRVLGRSEDFEGIWFKAPAVDVITVFAPETPDGFQFTQIIE